MAQIYEVQMPDGAIVEIEAEDDVSEEEVLKLAQDEYAYYQYEQINGGPAEPVAKEEPSVLEKIAGAGEAAATMVTGATTGAGAMIRGTLYGLAEEIASGEFGTQEAAQRIKQRADELAAEYTYQPRTPTGQEYTETVAEVGAQAAPLVGLAPQMTQISGAAQAAMMGGPSALRQAMPTTRAKQQATGQMPTTVAAAEAVEAAPPAPPAPRGPVQRVTEGVQAGVEAFQESRRAREQETRRLFAEEPESTEIVRERLINDRVVPDREAIDAIKQGFLEGVIGTVKASSPVDRKKMQQMLNIYKEGKKSEKFRALHRPTDVVGESLQRRIDYLVDERRQAGQDIARIADTELRGQQVDYLSAMDRFITDLRAIGVEIKFDKNGVARPILRDSDIQGDKQSERLLTAVLQRLSDVTAPDAYGVHKAKQFIDTQVSYGKRAANPLSQKTERLVKQLRRDLNEALGARFENYREANTQYSETTNALDQLQKAVGTKIDFDSANADKSLGTAARKLMSNYQSRVQMLDAIELANEIAARYGLKIQDDLIAQVIFANEIDRMFGAAAATSLKGQMQEAMRTGVEMARGDAVQRALDLALSTSEKMRGINEENAIKAIEALLKRQEKGKR